jgi:hypothetical protein
VDQQILHQPQLTPHPVQIGFVGVRELVFQAFAPGSIAQTYPDPLLNIQQYVAPYDNTTRAIVFGCIVSTKITQPPQDVAKYLADGNTPYLLRVNLVAQLIKPDETSEESFERWVVLNGIYLIYPYVREHVYSLTVRAGFRPAILPFLTVPTTPSGLPAAPAALSQ